MTSNKTGEFVEFCRQYNDENRIDPKIFESVVPLEIATQSLILEALSMTLTVASISSSLTRTASE
jgi:hypothetical protein